MKRWIAALLTVCMVFGSWMGAAEPVYGVTPEEPEWIQQTEAVLEEAEGKQTKAASANGRMEVEVNTSLMTPFDGTVTVHISNRDKTVEQTRELDFNNRETFSALAVFEVEEGEYTVIVSAARFADYTQQIQVQKDWISKIKVCAAKVETGSTAVPGWMLCGDVNQDKAIDQKDIEALKTAIRQTPEAADYDLNRDGKADLLDLQYAVQSINEEQESSVMKLGMIQGTQAAEGTVLESQDGSYTLKPVSGDEPISVNNPVSMDFILEHAAGAPEIQGMTIYAPAQTDEDGNVSSEITAGEAVVVYQDENGAEQEMTISLSDQTEPAIARSEAHESIEATGAGEETVKRSLSVEADGSLVLNFGTQIAVKRVTIRITGTKKTEPLVAIAKVEFVNNMEERIPAPQLDIPTLHTPVSEDKGLTVSWTPQINITGYEVSVTGPVKNQTEPETQIVRVSGAQHRISSINDKNMINFAEYTIKVRSVNGDWSSPWSNTQIGIPKPQKLPAPPDYVKAVGGYRSITVSWKDMDDADGYMVYYKKSADADTSYRPVVDGFTPVQAGTGKINGTSYTIRSLEDTVKYSVYVIGWNDLGWGKPSLVSTATTESIEPPQLPSYKLINTSNGIGVKTAHIESASYGGSGGAQMIGSVLDTAAGSALGLVDDDYGSYWMKEDWDDGVQYPASNKGMTVTLDADYEMDYMTFAAADQKAGVQTVLVKYWNSGSSAEQQIAGARLLERTDKNNKPFYIVKFNQKITANKIYLCLGRSNNSRQAMMVGEIRFHTYDSLEDDIMGLYEDAMHVTLRQDVTEETIAALETRLNTPDTVSGEKHPLYDELLLELENARNILHANLDPAYVVENQITARKDSHLGFGGLNAWQPLGKTAYAGEKLLVYVGHNTLSLGAAASLQLVFTQYHAEASTLARTVNLKVGRNEITVPQITTTDFEKGGQIYVAYTGNNASDQYAVRINGGSNIPVLSVYGKEGEERTNAIRAYVEALEAYVGTIEAGHLEKHKKDVSDNVAYDYDRQNCILNTTDIMMEEMMYSLPATQIWAGISGAADKVTKLDHALRAMEDTMTLFYQHKGLSDAAGSEGGKNAWPAQHLNIRYMRMFAGAFMYAAGNHIGIEWGSSVLSGVNDWNGFGWGIAHEIGHDINQGTYAVAEITNNYFAQLLTGKIRYQYKNVYDKVTSGTVGRASNVFTQLALYWQLHLAFDDNTEDRHIYDNYEEQFNNLFFARVDTYSRNPSAAPQPGLTLSGGDQNLMRLACAAANKNILPFFERWGMTPDADTIAYAEKYGAAETKALYYVNEEARAYRVANQESEKSIANKDVITAVAAAESNQVNITITADPNAADAILGYEVKRSMISNGKKQTQVIGFIPMDAAAESTVYTDTVSSINNRVMEYEVTAVDKFLNYSKSVNAGSAKIQTDGVLDKTQWTVETTMVSEDDIEIETDIEDPDNGFDSGNPSAVGVKKVNSIERILDNDRTAAGTYTGTSDGTSTVTVDMHKVEAVTALKIQGSALSAVTVEISPDGSEWTAVKENYSDLDTTKANTIWFDSVEEAARENWIGTYNARYLRLTFLTAGDISIQEIEICGPSGDNLEFMEASDGKPAIGILKEDYSYGTENADVIPAGSLIFTGTYKGNPAYNMVILYDTEGNVIGAKGDEVIAKQVIFADVPKDGNLGETSDGTWVYYVEPDQLDLASLKNISGVRGELYRVDNALTLEGERIVSDTQVISIPDTIPEITLKDSHSEE